MPSNLIENGDFEESDQEIQPWSCSGGDQCGINNPVKGTVAAHGNNFGYVKSSPSYSLNPSLTSRLQSGHRYSLKYYAYAWNFTDPSVRVGWSVQMDRDVRTTNLRELFNDTSVSAERWPQWNASFTAQRDGGSISFMTQPNTILFLDDVHLECTDCDQTNIGAIVGGVVGAVVLFILLVVMTRWCHVRKTKQSFFPHRASRSLPVSKSRSASSDKNVPPHQIEQGKAYFYTEKVSTQGSITPTVSSVSLNNGQRFIYAAPRMPALTAQGDGFGGSQPGQPAVHGGTNDTSPGLISTAIPGPSSSHRFHPPRESIQYRTYPVDPNKPDEYPNYGP